jgi:hypothetical protein
LKAKRIIQTPADYFYDAPFFSSERVHRGLDDLIMKAAPALAQRF